MFSACVGTCQCIMFMNSLCMECAYYKSAVTDFTYVLGTESWCRDSVLKKLGFFFWATFCLPYFLFLGGIYLAFTIVHEVPCNIAVWEQPGIFPEWKVINFIITVPSLSWSSETNWFFNQNLYGVLNYIYRMSSCLPINCVWYVSFLSSPLSDTKIQKQHWGLGLVAHVSCIVHYNSSLL